MSAEFLTDFFTTQAEEWEIKVSFILQENGQTYTAGVRELAMNDFPLLDLEGDDVNVEELDPRILDLLPPDFPGKKGDHITYPADGDEAKDRYTIENVQPMRMGDTTIHRKLLIYLKPRRK